MQSANSAKVCNISTRKIFFLFSIFFLLTPITTPASADEILDISAIQLVATPTSFDGKKVRLIGYLHLEFEGDAIYLHREDYDKSISKNSLAIELSKSQTVKWLKLNNCYVIIEGYFSSTNKGHFQMRSGSLRNIERLDKWSIRKLTKY